MIVRSSLTGAFPRSEELVGATRDFDRGRTSAEALEEIFRRTEADVLALEERLGADVRSAGYLRWPDLFRPIAESWGGFTVGPLTRWFETNTFFRQPVLHAPPERTPGAIASRLPVAFAALGPSRAIVLLPGPYTLAGLLDNRSGETPEALIHRIGRLLAEEVRELRSLGYRTFEFSEPLLVVRPPSGPAAESVLAGYRAIHEALGDGTSLLWTFFGDAAPLQPLLDRLPVSIVGIDLTETDPASLVPGPSRRGLGLGVIDPRTTLPEDPGEVAAIVRDLDHRLHPSQIWLGPAGPLDLLPAGSAARKLHLLPAARAALAAGGGDR